MKKDPFHILSGKREVSHTQEESKVVVKKFSNPPVINAEIIHKFTKLLFLLIIIGFSIKGLLIVKDKSY